MRLWSSALTVVCLGTTVCLPASLSRAAEAAATPEQIAFFEKSIRPVLVKECYSCHATTAEKIRGGLTLDTREGIRKGGDNGPAVVPGNVKKSLLLKAVKQVDDDLKMPPKKKLGDEVIADFEKWIAAGAADPRDGSTIIDHVDVDYVSSQQAVSRTPRPWEENCWITRLRVEDYYDSSAGG